MALQDELAKGISLIQKGIGVASTVVDFDPRYLNPVHWRLDSMGNFTNTWCTFQIGSIVGGDYSAAVVNGVSISLNKSLKMIETPIKGKSTSVFQKFATGGFDISINFIEIGPTFWQQNSKSITGLIEILDSDEQLTILNPQLGLIYGINRVVVTDYSIGQDETYYQRNPISISLKSDDDVDIFNVINPNLFEPVNDTATIA